MDLVGLNSVGVEAIIEAIEISDVIVIDEIGPMELYSSAFKEAVLKVMKSVKPGLGEVHYMSRDPLIQRIRGRVNAEIIEVTVENRDCLLNYVCARQFVAKFFGLTFTCNIAHCLRRYEA